MFIHGFAATCWERTCGPHIFGQGDRRPTGTTAAAACKAAILSLECEVVSVPVDLPCGLTVTVTVSGSGGIATSRKFAGDSDDVTPGCEFVPNAVRQPSGVKLLPRHRYWQVFTRHSPFP